jgi:hypothetical protein
VGRCSNGRLQSYLNVSTASRPKHLLLLTASRGTLRPAVEALCWCTMMVYRASKMSDSPRCPRMWRRCREVVRRTVSTLGESSGEIKGIYRVARLSYKPTTAPTNSCAVFYLCRPRSARPLVSTLVGAGPSSAEWSGQQRSTRDLRTSEPIQKFAA